MINSHIYLSFSGHYCPSGSSIPDLYPCEAGYYCVEGSADHVQCESGHYQDEVQSDTCKTCPAGTTIMLRKYAAFIYDYIA